MEPRRWAYIDALRGWAILMEVFYHTAQGRNAIEGMASPVLVPPLTLPPALATLATTAISGIYLFFVVSALSLTLSWRVRAISSLRDMRDYLIRRFFRVAPLFYAGIALYMVLYGWGPRTEAPEGIGVGDVAFTVAFLHIWRWGAVNSVVPGGWALGCFVMFWLALPAVMAIARERWRLAVLTVLGVVATQLLQPYIIARHGNAGPLGFHGFPAQATVFLFGTWAALFSSDSETGRSRPTGQLPGNSVSLALFLILVLVLPFAHLPLWLAFYRIQFAVLAALLCVVLRRYPAPILVNRVTVGVGRVCASMWILHFALLAPMFRAAQLIVDRLVGARTDDTALFLVYFVLVAVVSFAAAQVTYRLIERPFIRLGGRLIEHLRQGAPVAAA